MRPLREGDHQDSSGLKIKMGKSDGSQVRWRREIVSAMDT